MIEVVKGHDVALELDPERLQGAQGHVPRRFEGAGIDVRVDPDLAPFAHQQPHS